MRDKRKIRKLRGILKGTDALKSLMVERARDRVKEDAGVGRGLKPAAAR